MGNVQLVGKEVTVVFKSLDTGRILGFGVEGMPLVAPPGTRYTSTVLNHAADIERYSQQYREQCACDREEATVRRLESERPFRQAIRAAVMERNQHLDPWNRDINLRMMDAQDKMYDRILESRRKAEVCIVAEKYDENSDSVKMALDSPLLRPNNA